MKLYFNILSSYSQKALIAFYEKGVEFTPMVVDLMNPAAKAEFEKVAPMGKVPFLQDERRNWMVPESTTIIEYLDLHCTGPKLIPTDPDLARQCRFRDRFADLYLNEPMTKIFFDQMRPEGQRDAYGVTQARATLDKAYRVLDGGMEKMKSTWALGDTFTMADCSAAPALMYLRMVHPHTEYKNIQGYVNRLAERPSIARVLKEAEPALAAFMKK